MSNNIINLFNRLEHLLNLANQMKNSHMLQDEVSTLISLIPNSIPILDKDLLLHQKPALKNLVDIKSSLLKRANRKDFFIKKLVDNNCREDIVGHICDLMHRISLNEN